jgi:hypothetical protein
VEWFFKIITPEFTHAVDFCHGVKNRWDFYWATKGSKFEPILTFLRRNKQTIAASFIGATLAILLYRFYKGVINKKKPATNIPNDSPKSGEMVNHAPKSRDK